MEITQFTYFQQLGGLELDLIPAEITYGLDRIAMVDPGEAARSSRSSGRDGITWEDVYRENERQWSHYNFEEATSRCTCATSTTTRPSASASSSAALPLPAYDMVLKCSHAFNLLDARGAISVTERAAYIGRVRNLVRAVAQLYLEQQQEADAMPRCCLRSASRSCLPPRASRRRCSCPSSSREHLGVEAGRALHRPAPARVPCRDVPERTADEWVKGPPENLREKAARGIREALRRRPSTT